MKTAAESQATREYIEEHWREDVRELALGGAAAELAGVDLKYALRQIEGRQRATEKLKSWAENKEIVFPARISMEQCSSEATAGKKAEIVARMQEAGQLGKGTMADLTGGLGADFAHVCRLFERRCYVEPNEELCQIAVHNLGVLGLMEGAGGLGGRGATSIANQTAEAFVAGLGGKKLDLLMADPSRRDSHGGRTVLPCDCVPDLPAMMPQLRKACRKMLVKYSPMLDLTLACRSLGCVSHIWVVSVKGECKELLLWLDMEKGEEEMEGGDPKITCVNLETGDPDFAYRAGEEKEAEAETARGIGRWLLEPNASVMKSGAYKLLAQRYGCQMVGRDSHLLTCGERPKEFPGRVFRVTGTCRPDKKELGKLAPGIERSNMAVRNYPATPQELQKKLGLKDGGDTYIFATRLADKKRVLVVCQKG